MKLPKLPKFQVKKRIGKINKKKFKIKKPGKRTLMLLLAVLLVIAGTEIAKGFLKEFLKEQLNDGKKTEAVQEEQSGGTEDAETADLKSLKGNLGYDFIRTLRSGQYIIKYRTTTVYEGQSYEVETTYAVSGDRIALEAGDRATIVREGKVYMLNHADKTILSWDVAGKDDLKRIDTQGIEFVGSGDEGGLVCEEYKTASSGIKLYFDGKKPVRMETNINKIDTVMDLIDVSTKVPDSLFAVPADYRTTEID